MEKKQPDEEYINEMNDSLKEIGSSDDPIPSRVIQYIGMVIFINGHPCVIPRYAIFKDRILSSFDDSEEEFGFDFIVLLEKPVSMNGPLSDGDWVSIISGVEILSDRFSLSEMQCLIYVSRIDDSGIHSIMYRNGKVDIKDILYTADMERFLEEMNKRFSVSIDIACWVSAQKRKLCGILLGAAGGSGFDRMRMEILSKSQQLRIPEKRLGQGRENRMMRQCLSWNTGAAYELYCLIRIIDAMENSVYGYREVHDYKQGADDGINRFNAYFYTAERERGIDEAAGMTGSEIQAAVDPVKLKSAWNNALVSDCFSSFYRFYSNRRPEDIIIKYVPVHDNRNVRGNSSRSVNQASIAVYKKMGDNYQRLLFNVNYVDRDFIMRYFPALEANAGKLGLDELIGEPVVTWRFNLQGIDDGSDSIINYSKNDDGVAVLDGIINYAPGDEGLYLQEVIDKFIAYDAVKPVDPEQ